VSETSWMAREKRGQQEYWEPKEMGREERIVRIGCERECGRTIAGAELHGRVDVLGRSLSSLDHAYGFN
jgi:hypothetical protein